MNPRDTPGYGDFETFGPVRSTADPRYEEWEETCPECLGGKTINGEECEECGGIGTVIVDNN